jgi:hypothetical protein
VADFSQLSNYHIEEIQEFAGLSERTKNVCIKGSLETLYKILNYYLKNGNFKKIRNCGEKTNQELIELSHKYIEKYAISLDQLEMNDEDVMFERFKFFCFENFNIPSTTTENFRGEFFERRFPFFKYVKIVLEQVLNEREYFIFQHNFGFVEQQSKMTLQSIGDIYDITRERIRQISQMIPYKLEETISKFTREQEHLKNYFQYKLNLKNDFILIDNTFAEKINARESLSFTPKFYGLVFTIIYSKNFSMFQDKERSYKDYYLIRSELFRIFDFAGYYDDLYERINKRIEATYLIEFDHFLHPFLKTTDPDLSDRIKPIARLIAVEELDIHMNQKNQLVFERNTLVKLSEYIVDILEEKGKPMRLHDIHVELTSRTSKAPHNIESLRSSILSIEDIVAIGKTSTYSLKKWETIKTGTIKELVKEYLNQYNDPRHISDVTDYVVQFRNTSDKNILSNLKLDKTRTFVFFKKGYIGLRTKKYKRLSGKYGQLKLL